LCRAGERSVECPFGEAQELIALPPGLIGQQYATRRGVDPVVIAQAIRQQFQPLQDEFELRLRSAIGRTKLALSQRSTTAQSTRGI